MARKTAAPLATTARHRSIVAVSEEVVQRQCIELFRLHGGVVYTMSQGWRGHFVPGDDGTVRRVDARGGTRQTPGISDLEIFWGPETFKGAVQFGHIWWANCGVLAKFEVKTPAGMHLHDRMVATTQPARSKLKDWRRAQAQHLYEAACRRCGVPYARGGVPEALTWLNLLGVRKG